MSEYKTPGVYIKEKSAFPNSVVEAETAIPAFIGITERAENGDDSLTGKPWKISSMTEFHKYFGEAPQPEFKISITDTKEEKNILYQIEGEKKFLQVTKPTTQYTLYYHMILFFANGGGTCYVVSTGKYDEQKNIDKGMVDGALQALEKEQEITMIVIPEAVNNPEDCKDIQQLAIAHCGKMKNRFAIFDVQPRKTDNEIMDEQIKTFQTNIGSNFLSYGAVYYPWLNTSVLSDNNINSELIIWDYASKPDLTPFFPENSPFATYANACLKIIGDKKRMVQIPDIDTATGEQKKNADGTFAMREEPIDLTADELSQLKSELHGAMFQNWSVYQLIVKKVKNYLNLLPPSAAMAGIYTMVDNTRGVWKAPANVSVNYVNSPTETINNDRQADLNAPMNGKAINVIRAFPGEGIKIWGARTLDGNSLDWRYINVRRTMLFLEESVKNAARAYVFEPNDANTWLNMKCMIENFLRGVWKRGGLAGATPEDAFEVHVGLGDTMTPEDILEGIMRITVLVAISHPAEFIEITFQQQMQKS